MEFNLETQQSMEGWVVWCFMGHPDIIWFPERLWFNRGYFTLVPNTKPLYPREVIMTQLASA